MNRSSLNSFFLMITSTEEKVTPSKKSGLIKKHREKTGKLQIITKIGGLVNRSKSCPIRFQLFSAIFQLIKTTIDKEGFLPLQLSGQPWIIQWTSAACSKTMESSLPKGEVSVNPI